MKLNFGTLLLTLVDLTSFQLGRAFSVKAKASTLVTTGLYARIRNLRTAEMPILFSYGTLRDPEVQRKTFGRELHTDPDTLPRYAPSTAGAHANALFTGNPLDSVAGVALEVTEEDLSAADDYERPFNYRRQAVTLGSGRGAWVYVSA